MAFFEQRLPVKISVGATGGPAFDTQETRQPNGARFAARRRLWALHRYQLSQTLDSAEKFALLRNFFYVVGGRGDGFRFQAPDDHTCVAAESGAELVAAGVYQLVKLYAAFSRTYTRPIYKPVAAGFAFFRTRSTVTTDITGSSTLDTTTGRVTVTGHVSGDTYTWSGFFDIPVSFDSDVAVFRLLSGSNRLVDWADVTVSEYRLELPAP